MDEYKGMYYNIEQDEYPESPREWNDLTVMVCQHRRYNLGDVQYPDNYYDGWYNWFYHHLKEEGINFKDAIFLPLHLYDHSGITINTTGFSCKWDSGKVGFIYMTKAKAREAFKVKRITKKIEQKVLNYLIDNVEEYDLYLRGEVYRYKIYRTKDDIEAETEETSCGGFYGYSYCEKEVKLQIDWYVATEKREQDEKISSRSSI